MVYTEDELKPKGASGITSDSDVVKNEQVAYKDSGVLTPESAIGNIEMRGVTTNPSSTSTTNQLDQTQPSTTQQTSQAQPTIGDAYAGLLGTSKEQQAYYDELARQGEAAKTASQANESEADIRARVTGRFQDEIDALDRYYAEQRRLAEQQIKGQQGTETAIQGRRGLIGSTMGVAQQNKIETEGRNVVGGIEAQKTAAVSELQRQIDTETQAEKDKQAAAAKAGAAEYLNYLQGAADRKTAQIQDVATRAISLGTELSDADIQSISDRLGISAEQFKSVYNQLKPSMVEEAPTIEKVGDNLYQYDKASGTWTKVASAGQPITKEVNGVLMQYNETTGGWDSVAGTPEMSELDLYAAKKAIDEQYKAGEMSELEMYAAKKQIDAQYAAQKTTAETATKSAETQAKNAENVKTAKTVVQTSDEKLSNIDDLIKRIQEGTTAIGTTSTARGEESNIPVIGKAGMAARAVEEASGKRQGILADISQLTSQATMDTLLALKSAGGTLGALSDGERTMLENAATPLNKYAVKDENGNVIGYNATTDQVISALNDIKKTIEQIKSTATDTINGAYNETATTSQPQYNNLMDYVMASDSNADRYKQVKDTIQANFPDRQITEQDVWEAIQGLGFNGVGSDTNTATSKNIISSLESKIPAGTKYSADSNDGQCGYWSRKIVDYPSGTGNTLQEKKNFVSREGISKDEWIKQGIKVGDVIFTDESKQYGHVAVVAAINEDDTVTLAESNYIPNTVTYNRKLPINSNRIIGVVRGKLKNNIS